ncbi:MAG: nucleotidyltransferase [Flavobacteriaceae bacterium]|nr:nucleotidyltransferase [Flavobacteriaceae bacterium]|tara:strand:+ start:6756 stop:7577 length:822 start_codon:yes stop_codon:yes gene_type:complete
MAAGASSRMKASVDSKILTESQIESANTKSKVLIEFGTKSKPFISYSISNMIKSGFNKIYIVTSKDAHYFRNNFNDLLKIDLTKCDINFSVQYLPTNRSKPLGTADAIFQTMEQYPNLKSKSFCVCNGDNLYSVKSLKKIKSTKSNNAFIAYDRNGLNFSKERISSFSIAKLDEENKLIDIIEKPNKEIIKKSFDKSGKIRVSMNLFKFHGEESFSFFKNCPINKKRNEKEIPDVLKKMISKNNKSITGIPMSENVLDLTSKTDIIEIHKRLR